ncbi:MAG: hypothetical protein ACJ0BU_00565 [Candidatus Puniceispirillales bacterium]
MIFKISSRAKMPLCPDQGICFLVFGNFISGFNSHSCLIIKDFTFG